MGESEYFRWDDNKDRENRRKHGLPLLAAEALLRDPLHLDNPTRRAVAGELRRILVRQAQRRLLSCVYVWAGRKRHAISVRPASRKERRAYQANLDASRDRG
ncbi:MAG: BrnT family toxin [Microvirga sp.]